MKTNLLAVMALWSAGAMANEPSLTVTQLGENEYELLLVTDQTTDASVAQASLLPAVQQLCAGKTPRFAQYEFESAEPIRGPAPASQTITLRQQIRCEPTVAMPASPPAPPLAHDDRAIEALTRSYLEAKTAGRYKKAYAMLGPAMQESASFSSWSDSVRETSAKVGTVKSHRIKKITWYDNPPSAPVPGIYAAADYEAGSENTYVHCGYVVWLGASDGSFRIVREEENLIDRESVKTLTPQEISAFAQRFGCEVR